MSESSEPLDDLSQRTVASEQPTVVPTRSLATTDGSTVSGSPPAPGAVVSAVLSRMGDFEIVEELGRGAFATVYLSRQLSLGRLVALKVSNTQDSEARTLAVLEHEHIVRVFTETIDAVRGMRLLCMQFVPGTNLERLLRELQRRPRREWTGETLINAIDTLSEHRGVFDLAALRDRVRL